MPLGLYPPMAKSPVTYLAEPINESATTIIVDDISKLPDPPNIATIGDREDSETIRYGGKMGNSLTSVTRGFEGDAKEWSAGTPIANVPCAQHIRALQEKYEAHVDNTTDAHGIDVIAGDLDAHKAETAENAHKVENITGLAFPAFQYATLLNGWTALGGIGVRYRKNAQGVTNVQIFARPNSTVDSTNNTFAKLPEGYRPAIRVALPYLDGTRAIVYNGVAIATDGTVRLWKPAMDEIKADGAVSCEFVFIAKG